MKIGFFLDYMFLTAQLSGAERILLKLLSSIKHQYQEDVEILLISFDVSKMNLTIIELKQFSRIEINSVMPINPIILDWITSIPTVISAK